MTWQTLSPITLSQEWAYVPLPLAGAGGRVPLQVPSFAVGERGVYEVGIYDLPQGGPPGLVAAAQTAQIAPFTRSLVFEVPPSIAAPNIGLRLLSHASLETATYSVAVRWQPPYGSGDGGGTPVPSGFMAAVSWSEIKAAAIAEIAQGYATVESVTTGLAEIQEAIDALGTGGIATQQAIAALSARINALESSDPTQAQAIASLQQSLADLIASNATDAELAAALAGIQEQLDALASDAELAAAIGPIQSAINNLGGTYATDAELAAAIAAEALARTQADEALEGAIASIVPSGSDGNLLQRLSNGIAAIAGLIYSTATNILTLPGGIRIRPGADSTQAMRIDNAAGSTTIFGLNTVAGALTLRPVTTGFSSRPFVVQNGAGNSLLEISEDGRAYFGGVTGQNIVLQACSTDSKIPLMVSDSSGNLSISSGLLTSNRASFGFGANNFGSAVEVAPSNNFVFQIKGARLAVNSGSPTTVPSPAWIYVRGDSNAVHAFRLDNTAGNPVAVITSSGGLGTSDTVANSNTPSGATARAMRVYNELGGLIGFVPIYQNQW